MAIYEYVCTECGEKVEVRATISEKEKGLKVTCPKCGSKEMARVFGSFMVMGSSSSKHNLPMCGPTAGPGCCG
jgi:putative FmdB family regulatory protein